ncbi:MAG: peptidoglycan DD-metalloendopeptidase family protein [Beijerinckiaceae bacterium]
MSLREGFPKARVSNSHFFLTLARGDNIRCLAVRPWALYAAAGLFPVCGMMYFAASMVFLMRDNVVSAVFERQQLVQQAYEDRIAEMRTQIDRISSRQLLDQNSLEGKMHELISRQARLETRSAVVAQMARMAGAKAPATPGNALLDRTPVGSISNSPTGQSIPLPPQRPASLGTSRSRDSASLMPGPALGYAGGAARRVLTPAEQALARATSASASALPGKTAAGRQRANRPRPHAMTVLPETGANAGTGAPAPTLQDTYAQAIAANPSLPVDLRLSALAQSLDTIEAEQIRKVATVGAVARQRTQKLRQVIAATGLSPDRMKAPAAPADAAIGGPFVPYKFDPDGPAFERAVLGLQKHVVEAARLQRLVSRLPLRRPLPASAEITSTFGRRVDPFNGRIATHTGLDFRQHHGAPVYATAGGKIVKAGVLGGYGNVVEIDHGNGVTSRYAHLSAFAVSAGQHVAAGARIGSIGSTGRSTGPHLHYEVRIGDAPVNPARFIRAGAELAQR